MDETQIRRGSPDEPSSGPPAEQSLAPLKTDVEPAAYQRAPTLMAGASAGSQGQVRVWAPSRKLLWGLAIGSGAASVLMLLFSTFAGGAGPRVIFFVDFICLIFSCVASVSALRRPGYITTDDAGIGITTRRGSLPLQWSEIKAIRRADSTNEIVLLAPDRVDLNVQGKIALSLCGYPAALRKELVALIAERSGLEASRSHPPPELFIRPGYTAFNNWCHPVEELPSGMDDGEAVAHADFSHTDTYRGDNDGRG